MINKVAETIGYKELFHMAEQVGVGEIGLLGMLKGTRSIAASAGSLKKAMSLFKKCDKEIKKGDGEAAINFAKEGREEITKVMSKPGNAALFLMFGKTLTEIDSKIAFLESGKNIKEYIPTQSSDGGKKEIGKTNG